MRRNLVIMTKSKKGDDGYCVTGIDINTNEWIRLNIRGEYSFPRHLFCYKSGVEIAVLDTISVELTSKDRSSSIQPENYFCDPHSILPISADCEQVILSRIAKDKELHGSIFFNDSNRVISESLPASLDEAYSLMIVEPENLLFRRNTKGRLLAYFDYKGTRYSNIRVTDIDYNNSEAFLINQPVYANKQMLMVMSLGEKFYNPTTAKTENWKFVAAIIERDQIKERQEQKTARDSKEDIVVQPKGFDVQNIIIKAEQTPGKASFENYEELKQYFQKNLEVYNNTKYSLDNASQAIADFEVLKALRKKLTAARKSIETAYTLPIREVIEQLDSLIDMVKEPYGVIDKMLKDNAKAIKKREIKRYAYNKALILDQYAISVVESPAFFNPRWLNVSYSDRNWQKDVDAIIHRAKADIESIEKEGGENKAIVLAYYLDRLSLDGIQTFINNITKTGNIPQITESLDNNKERDGDSDGSEINAIDQKDDQKVENVEPITLSNSKNTVSKEVILSGSEKDIGDYLRLASRFNVAVLAVADAPRPSNNARNEKDQTIRPFYGKKKEFHITESEKEMVQISSTSLPISTIARNINAAVNNQKVKKISYKNILKWLVDQEYIVEEETKDQVIRKPTDKGTQLGIILDQKLSETKGYYYITYYPPDVQRLIVEHVNEMV